MLRETVPEEFTHCGEKRIPEMVAKGDPLPPRYLTACAVSVEEQIRDSLASNLYWLMGIACGMAVLPAFQRLTLMPSMEL